MLLTGGPGADAPRSRSRWGHKKFFARKNCCLPLQTKSNFAKLARMKPLSPPCLATLRALLDYDANTGQFTRKIEQRKKPIGSTPGGLSKYGYWQISVLGRTYTAQRLAWYYVYGDWPSEDIDHINRNKLDNRIANLRKLSRSDNLRNRDGWVWRTRKKAPPVKQAVI